MPPFGEEVLRRVGQVAGGFPTPSSQQASHIDETETDTGTIT
jgi:hypothetical protein